MDFTDPFYNYFDLTLYQTKKILDVTKLKAFSDDKVNEAQLMISIFGKAENIVGKGENAGYQHFLFFPQCFQKDPFLGYLLKSWDCVLER